MKEADYTAAADASEPASGQDDDTLGENGKAWQKMLNNIFSTVTQCRVMHESDVISDLSALADTTTGQIVASGRRPSSGGG